MRAGLYIRVSTDMQVDRDSLPTQEKLLKRYCETHDLKPVQIYREAGESAKDMDRPELERLKADVVAKKLECVLVVRLDRITRSNRDLWQLVEFFDRHDVTFVSTTENFDTRGPMGRFMLNMLASLAQMERETLARRVSEAMYSRAEDGKWNGGVIPYGYTTQSRIREEAKSEKDKQRATEICPEDKILYVDESEATIIRSTYAHYLKTRSLRSTVRWLNAQGYRTRRGKLWASSTVHRILSSPFYVKKVTYGKRTTDINSGKLRKGDNVRVSAGKHPPIVDQATFDSVQTTFGETALKPTRAPRTYLLTGIIRCGVCGGPMYGYTMRKAKGGQEYFYYRCHNHTTIGEAACKGNSIPGHPLEAEIVKTLKDLSKDEPFLKDKEKLIARFREQTTSKATDSAKSLDRLKSEEADIRRRIDTLLDKLETQVIDDTTFKSRHEQLQDRLTDNRAAQRELGIETESSTAMRDSLEASYDEIASFSKNWQHLDDAGRANLLRTVVKRISATRENIDMQVFLDVAYPSRTDKDSSPRPG